MNPEYPIFSTTLCYLERDDAYLMLHRVKKEDDYNHDKWVGVGGKFERFESPEDCLLREVKEETGLTLTHWRSRGLLTFIWGNMTEFIHLYTADGWTGEMIQGDACREGVLEWVPKERVEQLPIWEGDKIFFKLLNEEHPWFSLKLVYEGDVLRQAVLDGNSHYYLMLEDSDAIYDVSVADIIDVIKCELGEQVTVTYKEDKDVNTVTKLDIGEKAKDKTSSDKIEKETGTQE